jgi:hypothetical protein
MHRLLAATMLVACASATGIGSVAAPGAGATSTRQSACAFLQGHAIRWPEASCPRERGARRGRDLKPRLPGTPSPSVEDPCHTAA